MSNDWRSILGILRAIDCGALDQQLFFSAPGRLRARALVGLCLTPCSCRLALSTGAPALRRAMLDAPDGSFHHLIRPPGPLATLFRQTVLAVVPVDAINIPTWFRGFDDYCQPRLLPDLSSAQRYVTSLGEGQWAAQRDTLETTLAIAADGSIPLIPRAWAVRGTK